MGFTSACGNSNSNSNSDGDGDGDVTVVFNWVNTDIGKPGTISLSNKTTNSSSVALAKFSLWTLRT
jgi:hypothetical protein